jgi:Lar family restriction alleviation protein
MQVELAEGVTLKACPFCGSEPTLRTDSGDFSTNYWVKCPNKFCSVSPAATNTQSAAISAWNVRA